MGFIPQSEGIRYLEESDYLLLIANDPVHTLANCSTPCDR
jgi:hypothetical protein